MTNPIPNPQPPKTIGPRTAAGKQRSSMNAVTHGLTGRSPVLATEDPAEYQRHCRQFLDEYQSRQPNKPRIDFDIVDAHRALAALGLHYTRLSRQFQKAVGQLREIQSGRAERERRDLKKPPPSWNSINTKDFPGSPPIMGSFFQRIESRPFPNA
jgi:hypothetical protein